MSRSSGSLVLALVVVAAVLPVAGVVAAQEVPQTPTAIEPVGETAQTPYGTEHRVASRATGVVEQTDATVTIRSVSESAGFNEGVFVSGQVTADGTGVPDVPVVLSIDGERFGRTNTTADGEFTVMGRLPKSVPAGEQTLRVTALLDDGAGARSTGTHPVTVTETDTELTIDTNQTSSSITVTGALRTTDDEVVLDQDIEIRRNGSVVATATTGPGGTYEATIPGESNETYRLSASYADPTTNLGASSASTTVTLPVRDTGAGLFGQGLALVGGVLLLVLLLGGVFWWRREESEQPSENVLWTRDDVEAASRASADDVASANLEDSGPNDSLAAARAALDEDDADASVGHAYTAVRQELRSQGLGSEDATHWEFFQACADADLEHLDALETLTQLYEQAAFGPGGVEQADAEAALEAAERLR